MEISFIIPTRKRTEKLKRLLDSLESTCNNKDNYEVILAFDSDDKDHYEQFASWTKNYNHKSFIIDRLGFDHLEVYCNKAAEISSGKWLWWWADDSYMTSKDWDSIIKEYDDKFVLLNPWHALHESYIQEATMFPIVPRKYYEILGYVSPWNHVDTYVERILKPFGLMKNEFRITHDHDRDENDETHKEVIYHRRGFPLQQYANDMIRVKKYLDDNRIPYQYTPHSFLEKEFKIQLKMW
jgi:glycosyltransferase involved in cell wall biosynthesis